MRILLFLIITFQLSNCYSQALNAAKSVNLFLILEKNKYGYINSDGDAIIKPKFFGVGEFSEGLAPARLNGTYGYINTKVEFVIEPQFDYATEFHEDFAVVYIDSTPFFIDKSGNRKFDINFSSVEPFENGKAYIRNSSGKAGIINKRGELIIDTAFMFIGKFNDGLAMVREWNELDKQESVKRIVKCGVIDTLGRFVVPYGIYKSIYSFVNGYSKVEKLKNPDNKDDYSIQEGFIDKYGDIVFLKDKKNSFNCIYDNVYKGFFRIGLYSSPELEKKRVFSSRNSYTGIIDLNGKYILNDTTYKYIKEFSENRTFARDYNRDYYLLNTKGKLVNQQIYKNVLGKGFNNGLAFVETEKGWGAIDTNANFIIEPKYKEIHRSGLIGDVFFFYGCDSSEQEENKLLCGIGIADRKGKIVLKPSLQVFDRDGFKKGLLNAVMKNKFVYVNLEGKIIWEEKEEDSNPVNLNIDFMRWGHYGITNRKQSRKYGYYTVWGESFAIPQKVSKSLKFPIFTFSIIARPEEKDIFSKGYNGFRLYVVNNTCKPVTFNAQDGMLYLKLQAKDKNGQWKNIEFMPSSSCGNSYHTTQLEPQMYCSFVIPKYEGEFKTKMRAELKYVDPDDKRKEKTIYSNEFDGNVNPGQFWRQNYYYNDFMSPYSYWK